MKFERIRIHKLGPFTDLDVNLAELRGPLVAVRGRNGAGKTTFLELLLGALWRKCPTRGSLIDLTTADDASVTVDLQHGGRHYTVRQLVDGIARKGEAFITNGDGRPLVESSKRSAVDSYIEQHFPPLDVLLVSTFASQQSQGFIDADPAIRKGLLLRMLGIEQLEVLAGGARARMAIVEKTLLGVKAALAQEQRNHALTPEHARELLTVQRSEAEAGEQGLAAMRRQLEMATAAEARREEWESRQREWKREADRLEQERAELVAKARDADTRIANNRDIVARTEEITEAAKRIDELERLIPEKTADMAALESEARTINQRGKAADQERGAAFQRKTRFAPTAALRPAVDAAKKRVDALDLEMQRLAAAAEEREREADALRDKASANRIGDLRQGLASIRDSHSHIDAARETATKVLLADTAAASAADGVPAAIAARDVARRAAHDKQAELQRSMKEAAQEETVATAETELALTLGRLLELDTEMQSLIANKQRIEEMRADLLVTLDALRKERDALAPKAKLISALAVANARIEELTAVSGEAAKGVARVADRMQQLGNCPATPTAVNVEEPARLVRGAEVMLRELQARVTRAEEQLATAEKAALRRAELDAEITAAAIEVADWSVLAKDLGKDGLQATLIDAALPELQAIVNSLLHSNFGPRFTVEIRSQVSSSKGKLLETLDVIVLDGESGREAPVETYSGGERAIISEGLSLALTTLASRESGLSPATLIRDEAGAALDPANGRAWIGMLRQAVAMMGADKLLFVSHSPELAELADSRVDL